MEYNWKIKKIDEVFEEFPQFKGKVEGMPFYRLVKKFKKEELNDLIDDAKFYGEKVTLQKREIFEEIAEARAILHFCWGWNNIFNACFSFGVPNENIVKLVNLMLSENLDLFSIENPNVTADFLYHTGKANSPSEI